MQSAPLPPGFSADVDTVDAQAWHRLVDDFDDANIYQTWPYEAERSGERHMSHFLLRREGAVVAAAQVRITKLPLTGIGVAYVRWGPLWRPRGQDEDPQRFALALRGLRGEYAGRRGLTVRILVHLHDDRRELFDPILATEGFERVPEEAVQRTLLISLERPLEELRKGLDQKWRNALNKSEKSGLEIREGTGDDLFATFLGIYAQMHERKQFTETSDVSEFRAIQPRLPESQKLRIAIAESQGKPAAGVICSRMGDTGIYLYGGTSDAGLGTNASYLAQWRTLAWLKDNGARWYNLHGINPETNPGTYRFKAGFCGKNGKDIRYLGVYDASAGAARQAVFRIANSARLMYKKFRR